MKLANRTKIEDTGPVMYIGHRVRRTGGVENTSRFYYAEFSLHGKKRRECLNTSNKVSAKRAVYDIINRLHEGDEERAIKRRITWQEVVDPYLAYLRIKGRAPKTMEKYEYVLNDLKKWAERTKRVSPTKFRPSDFWAFNGDTAERELAETTRYDRLIIVKQAFKWGQRKEKLLAINYIEGEELEEPEGVSVAAQLDQPLSEAVLELERQEREQLGEMAELRPVGVVDDEAKSGRHAFHTQPPQELRLAKPARCHWGAAWSSCFSGRVSFAGVASPSACGLLV